MNDISIDKTLHFLKKITVESNKIPSISIPDFTTKKGGKKPKSVYTEIQNKYNKCYGN
jgi:hypothetical protein